MIFVTSDLHFNHENILKYEPISRPFKNVSDMNETLIANWNCVVATGDTVYVLGDLCMGQIAAAKPLIQRLNGTIILVRGNHDTPQRINLYTSLGIEVRDIAYLAYRGRYFIMCHFPIASQEFINMVIRDNSEVVTLYGHIHSNAPTGYKDGTFHVGVDTNKLTPVSIQEVWDQCWPQEVLAKNPEVAVYRDQHAHD